MEPTLTRHIEELSLNALPALQTVLYDGWVLRFANGYSKRANSVNPLYSGDRNVAEKIAACEDLFQARQQKVVFKLTPSPCPAHQVSDRLTPQWFDHYCTLNQVEERHQLTLAQMLPNITGKTAYVSLVRDGKVVACGLGVLEGLYVGLYDIITAPAWPNQGLGHALVHEILAWARQNGARTAYLQVVAANAPALRSSEFFNSTPRSQ